MAYNEQIADRIRLILFEKNIEFSEKKMFSGLCFMVDDKMYCATHFDKKIGQDVLLCRIGENAYETAIERDDCLPMEFTGKALKGYVYVMENGFQSN